MERKRKGKKKRKREKKDKDDSFKGAYVNQDLTPKQQEELKSLRRMLKEPKECGNDAIIFRNNVVLCDNIKNFRTSF